MEQTKIDYNELFGEAEESVPIWKPSEGTHTVVFLSEAEKIQPFKRKDGIELQQIRFLVSIQAKEYYWYVIYGKTSSSLWGQLRNLVKDWGKFSGKVATVGVKFKLNSNGSTYRDYWVSEQANNNEAIPVEVVA